MIKLEIRSSVNSIPPTRIFQQFIRQELSNIIVKFSENSSNLTLFAQTPSISIK